MFANSRDTVDMLVKQLGSRKHQEWRLAVIHGGMSQDKRERAIEGLRSGQSNVLVATDVAGRGLDVPEVQLVINYDMPRLFRPTSTELEEPVELVVVEKQ